MANTNCLQGMQCPNCKSDGPFFIEVSTLVLMSDDGWICDANGSDNTWEDTSYCRCDDCGHANNVAGFHCAIPLRKL